MRQEKTNQEEGDMEIDTQGQEKTDGEGDMEGNNKSDTSNRRGNSAGTTKNTYGSQMAEYLE